MEKLSTTGTHLRGITIKVRVKDGFLEEITVNLKGKDQKLCNGVGRKEDPSGS